ncbi:MAG TPA: glycosyltransferase family 1 protein [Anaerolineales bacterium]|nr:glycosyltransferase family 1 protein [Anaerolineales bacterium]
MKVFGVDASRALLQQRTGTETYARELIRALLAQPNSAVRWRLYLRQPAPPVSFPAHAEQTVLPMRRLWTHVALARELAQRPPSVLFVPAHVRPLWCPVPSVITLHDLGHLHFPRAHTRWQRWYLHWSTRHAVQYADHLLADSACTRQDLQTYYGADPARVTVVYPGFDPTPFENPSPCQLALPQHYLLFVGTLQPRKNLARLLDAFAQVAPHFPQLHLVLAGRHGWLSEPIVQKARTSPLAGRIQLLDYVPDSDLPGLYAGAQAFVFPSLYEGFGFPILEAMAAGVPVVCSDGGSLPEVAGVSAARIVPAQDSAALADALAQVLSQPSLRQTLIAHGKKRCQEFRWEESARQVLAVLDRVS